LKRAPDRHRLGAPPGINQEGRGGKYSWKVLVTKWGVFRGNVVARKKIADRSKDRRVSGPLQGCQTLGSAGRRGRHMTGRLLGGKDRNTAKKGIKRGSVKNLPWSPLSGRGDPRESAIQQFIVPAMLGWGSNRGAIVKYRWALCPSTGERRGRSPAEEAYLSGGCGVCVICGRRSVDQSKRTTPTLIK